MLKQYRISLTALSIVLLFSLFFSVIPAQAAGIVVNTNTDTDDGTDGLCSLREAIIAANTDAAYNGCSAGSGADTITFAGNYVISLDVSSGGTGTQLPDITSAITITGNGETDTIIQASTCNPVTLCTPATNRILYVDFAGDLSLNSLTLRHGKTIFGGAIYNNGTITNINNTTFFGNGVTDNGGAINNAGTITTISNTTFSGNSAFISGGGVYNAGTITTLSNTTFSGNSVNTSGGGIFNLNTITTLTNTTFKLNYAGTNATNNDTYGGGIYNTGTITTLSNNLFNANAARNNVALAQGGGIYNGGTTTSITNNTFDANTMTASVSIGTTAGGGIYNNDTITTLANNTFANHSATPGGTGLGIYNNSIIFSFTNNLLSNNANASCAGTIPATTNSLASDTTCGASLIDSVANIGLNTLADNGGPTETMSLDWDSVALSAADPAACAGAAGGKDQRGVTRATDACDIGAFERDAEGPAVVSYSLVSSYVSTGPNSFTIQFNVNLDNSGGGTDPDDAENPDNYILVEEGTQAGFQTTACRASDNDFVNDTLITTNSVSFDHDTYIATIGINGGTELPVGSYRLFVCGTTSIVSPDNSTLNGGDTDTTEDFVVIAATATPTATSTATVTPTPTATAIIPDNTTPTPTAARPRTETLPDTGFAPNVVTELNAQPANLTYASTDLVLTIPSLGVSQTIVGVPQTTDGWNVSWLGNGIGYLAGTAFPTWAGNTALTGHVWNADGSAGIFANLNQLQSGDRFTIEAWGLTYTYEVRDSEQVYETNLGVLSHSDYDIVTLITCEDFSEWSGEYHYRRAVTAVLIAVK